MKISIKGITVNTGHFGQIIADGEMLLDGKIVADFCYTVGKKDVNLSVNSDDLEFYGFDYKQALRVVTDAIDAQKAPKNEKKDHSCTKPPCKCDKPVKATVDPKTHGKIVAEFTVPPTKVGTTNAVVKGNTKEVVSRSSKLFDYIAMSIGEVSHGEAIAYGKKLGIKDPARVLREFKQKGSLKQDEKTKGWM